MQEQNRNFILQNCTKCGKCAQVCPSIEIAEIDNYSCREIQKNLYEFIENPVPEELSLKRISSCIDCFKCIDICPSGVNPLMMIYTAKSLASDNRISPWNNSDSVDYSTHYKSIKNDLSRADAELITSKKINIGSKILFFPGCNIYNDSKRLVKVLDIFNKIDSSYTFLPGIKNCCGDMDLFSGRMEKAEEKYRSLIKEIEKVNPEEIILWCPTCMTLFKKIWNNKKSVKSFFQYVLEHINELSFTENKKQLTAVIHEPCKTAYTNLDSSHRLILQRIPGFKLKEMKNPVFCCGSGGFSYYRNRTAELITKKRLKEAEESGADLLITACHYCQEVFTEYSENRKPGTVNLADIIHERICF